LSFFVHVRSRPYGFALAAYPRPASQNTGGNQTGHEEVARALFIHLVALGATPPAYYLKLPWYSSFYIFSGCGNRCYPARPARQSFTASRGHVGSTKVQVMRMASRPR